MNAVGGRPNRNQYYMGIAMAVRERADCKGQKVGAIVVVKDRIVSTGYNGTPSGMTNCSEGGCVRCENRGKTYSSGQSYDLCICVHAEQNALLAAARFGISVEGATMYTTTQPCFGCLKEMLQAKISQVFYLHPWSSPRNAEQEQQYALLLQKFEQGVIELDIEDPRKEWALNRAVGGPVKSVDQHGMEL